MAFDLSRALRAQEGKALVANPAFMGLEPVTTYQPGVARADSVISQREAARHLDVYGGRQAIDWVYDCIGLYADPVSAAPYKLTKKDGTHVVRARTKGTPPDFEVGPADLYRLLDQPNPYMMYDELMSLLVIDLMLVGNAYWYKWQVSGGKPLALYRLSPAHVKVVPGEFGPKRYEYKPPGVRDALAIQVDEIVHFRRANPHSNYYGVGVIQGGGRAMDLELAITNTMASYFENNADPSLIVQSERRVPRDVFNKLRAQLRSRVAGSSKSGELLVLEAGLKASTLSANARDAMFADLSRMSRDRVMAQFRASPMLFGIMDESSSSNKISDVRREFDNYALLPFMRKLQAQITIALLSAWDLTYSVDYRVALPSDEAIKVAESVAKMPGVKIREVRAQYSQFGIEESTGDVKIDEEILNLPGTNLGPTGQPVTGGAGFADQPLGSEPGRPPLVKNTQPIRGANGKVNLPAGSQARASGKALIEEASARLAIAALEEKALESAGNVSIGSKLTNEQRPLDRFAQFRKNDIDATRNFVMAGLAEAATALERDLLDHVEGKALKTSDLVSRIKRSEAWKTFSTAVAAVLEEGARRAASSAVMHSGLTPGEDVDYDSLAKGLVHRPEGVRGIVNTLKQRVIDRVKAARDNNAERVDYQNLVLDVITEWNTGQSQTVADSEATVAYNEATLLVAELSGIGNVYVTDGDDHDQPCKDADGQVWTTDHARAHRIEHPNCRRAFLPMTTVA